MALGYLMYEQLEHMRGRLLPILVSVVVGCVVGVLSVVYLARMLGADRIFANFACSEIRDGADRRIGCGTARRHHYDHLGRRLLCRYFRQSRRSLAASALRGHGSYGTGIRAGVCGAWHRNGRAIEIGALEGALSGLAMALMGIMTALLLPVIEKFLY